MPTHYVNTGFATFSKIDGELLFSIQVEPYQHLFADSKNDEKYGVLEFYKGVDGNFYASHQRDDQPLKLKVNGFSNALTALFFNHELNLSENYFNVLAKEGELNPSENLLLHTIGDYKPSDLKVLYVHEIYKGEDEEPVDVAVFSNAKQFYFEFNGENKFSLASKDNLIQLNLDVEDAVVYEIENEQSIAHAVQDILLKAKEIISAKKLSDLAKSLMIVLGEMGFDAPTSITMPESFLSDLTSTKTFINEGKKMLGDDLVVFRGTCEGKLREYVLDGKQVAASSFQNMHYAIYECDDRYVLAETSKSQLNDVFAYINLYRFEGFNHNCNTDYKTINLPKEVYLDLQGQMGFPNTALVHGNLSTVEKNPLICKDSIGKGHEILVIGKPLTTHFTDFGKVSTYVSGNNINLVISLTTNSAHKINSMKRAHESLFRLTGLDVPYRMTETTDVNYVCVSSQSEDSFFSIIRECFNDFCANEESTKLIALNRQTIYEFIEEKGLLNPSSIYIF